MQNFKEIKNLVIMPMRSGSKRLENKNIRFFMDKPIFMFPLTKIYWGMDRKNWRYILSVDCDTYVDVIKVYASDFLKLFEIQKRTDCFGDRATLLDLAKHIIFVNKIDPKYVTIVYAPSPFFNEACIYHIDNFIRKGIDDVAYPLEMGTNDHVGIYFCAKFESLIRHGNFLDGCKDIQFIHKGDAIDIHTEEDLMRAAEIYVNNCEKYDIIA